MKLVTAREYIQAALPLEMGPVGPDFEGETYDPLVDYERLSQQLQDVWDTLTSDPDQWWTLDGLQRDIQARTGRYHTEAGLSARLRDLRKPRHGRYVVERQRVVNYKGLFAYRLDPDHYRARLMRSRLAYDVRHRADGVQHREPGR